MKQILVLCALVTVVLSDWTNVNWHTTEDGKLYYIEAESEFNWFTALQECTRKNMSLMSLDSVDKHLQMYDLQKRLFRDISQPRLWIGGHDNAVFGRFEWVATGQTFGFSNWAVGEPNDEDETEHCVAVWSNALGWNDAPCSSKMGFICEENQVLMPINRLLLETTLELVELKSSTDAQTLKAQRQELAELEKSYQTQTNQLKQKQEELDALKKSSEVQENQLRQTQEELDLLKKYQEEDMLTNSFNEDNEEQDSFDGTTETLELETQSLNQNADLDTLKKSCQGNQLSLHQSLAKLEALKRSHNILANRLKQRTAELEALKKSNEKFTGQTYILDGLNKPQKSQTNGTVTNRFYNFVVNVNEY